MIEIAALSFFYLLFLLKIYIINNKTRGKTEAYTFISLIFPENSLFSNLLLFENLNVIQIDIDETD